MIVASGPIVAQTCHFLIMAALYDSESRFICHANILLYGIWFGKPSNHLGGVRRREYAQAPPWILTPNGLGHAPGQPELAMPLAHVHHELMLSVTIKYHPARWPAIHIRHGGRQCNIVMPLEPGMFLHIAKIA